MNQIIKTPSHIQQTMGYAISMEVHHSPDQGAWW